MSRYYRIAKDDTILNNLKQYINDVDKNWNYVTPKELHDMKKNDLFLLDIREEKVYEEGHIVGAKNIFWKDILDNLEELPKDKKIILICYVGHTASQVMVMLRLLGYDVIALKFGMGISPVKGIPVAGWLDYGYDVSCKHIKIT